MINREQMFFVLPGSTGLFEGANPSARKGPARVIPKHIDVFIGLCLDLFINLVYVKRKKDNKTRAGFAEKEKRFVIS